MSVHEYAKRSLDQFLLNGRIDIETNLLFTEQWIERLEVDIAEHRESLENYRARAAEFDARFPELTEPAKAKVAELRNQKVPS